MDINNIVDEFIHSRMYDEELFKEIEKYIYKRYAPLIDFIEYANEQLASRFSDSFIMFFDASIDADQYYPDTTPFDKDGVPINPPLFYRSSRNYDNAIVEHNLGTLQHQQESGYFDINEYKHYFFGYINTEENELKEHTLDLSFLNNVFHASNELSVSDIIEDPLVFVSLWVDYPCRTVVRVGDLYIQVIIGFRIKHMNGIRLEHIRDHLGYICYDINMY